MPRPKTPLRSLHHKCKVTQAKVASLEKKLMVAKMHHVATLDFMQEFPRRQGRALTSPEEILADERRELVLYNATVEPDSKEAFQYVMIEDFDCCSGENCETVFTDIDERPLGGYRCVFSKTHDIQFCIHCFEEQECTDHAEWVAEEKAEYLERKMSKPYMEGVKLPES